MRKQSVRCPKCDRAKELITLKGITRRGKSKPLPALVKACIVCEIIIPLNKNWKLWTGGELVDLN